MSQKLILEFNFDQLVVMQKLILVKFFHSAKSLDLSQNSPAKISLYTISGFVYEGGNPFISQNNNFFGPLPSLQNDF